MTAMGEREALVALLRHTDARKQWRQTALDVIDTGSALEILRDRSADQLFDPTPELLERAQQEIATWEAAGIRVLSFFDAEYPAQLRDVHDFPPIVFTRGSLVENDIGICLVGSRDASNAGIEFATDAAALLAREGITVISGLARGIDTAAHSTVLEYGGRTVAVIGTGIEKYYPAENCDLQREIEQRGLVLSQFWPEAPPAKQSFPMRNATMSAYGTATVVVEAGEQSGARIQARQAVEHGRPLILTRAVVRSTDWGKQFADMAGDIYVVDDVNDMLHIIREVLNRAHRLDDLLESLR